MGETLPVETPGQYQCFCLPGGVQAAGQFSGISGLQPVAAIQNPIMAGVLWLFANIQGIEQPQVSDGLAHLLLQLIHLVQCFRIGGGLLEDGELLPAVGCIASSGCGVSWSRLSVRNAPTGGVDLGMGLDMRKTGLVRWG